MIRILWLTSLFLTPAIYAAQNIPAPKRPIPSQVMQQEDPGGRIFKANCGRCHSAPEGLPPRISGTVLMHMRVRANLSAKDQEALLKYLAP